MSGEHTLDKLPRWSFAGIRLVIAKAEVSLAIRDYVHEYPHCPGGNPEKLGRKLYEISCSGFFDNEVNLDDYSGQLAKAQKLFELASDETTDDLVIPWLGTMKAYATSFRLGETNTNRSGLSYDISFREDQSNQFTLAQIAAIAVQPMAAAAKMLEDEASSLSIFDKIKGAVDGVLALKDQAELYSALISSKIGYLCDLCALADQTVNELMHPENALAAQALMKLWESAVTLKNDILETGSTMSTYTVPSTMSVDQVARNLWGDPSRSGDLLGLNVIIDASAIKAGTKLKYYAE